MSRNKAADTFEEFATNQVNESSAGITSTPDELDIHAMRKLIDLGLIPSGEEYENLPYYRKRFRWMAMNANSAHEHVQKGEYARAAGELESLLLSARLMLDAVRRAMDAEKNEHSEPESKEDLP